MTLSLPGRLVLVVLLVSSAACGGGGGSGGGDGGGGPATTAAPDDGAGAGAGEGDTPAYVDTVAALEEVGDGRDNGSDGSRRAQERIVEELTPIAEPVPGGDGFRHAFDDGTNLLGVIPGTTTPDEVVVLGAHYDGLGHDCPSAEPDDEVCDGAGDNAAGVAIVLELGRRLAADPPDRTVVLALWDAEEDERLGSIAAVASGAVDTDAVVAYLNWDIQGVDLLPALADTTLVVGAETGGPALEAAVTGADAAGLRPIGLSLLFGQGRSDHASFVEAGVASVFFSDATSGCYHTAQDDLAHLDTAKLGRQVDLGEAVLRSVTGAGEAPTFVADTPTATLADAEGVLALVERAEPDLGGFPEAEVAEVEEFRDALEAMVADGEAAFDEDDVRVLLGGTAELVELFEQGDCVVPPG